MDYYELMRQNWIPFVGSGAWEQGMLMGWTQQRYEIDPIYRARAVKEHQAMMKEIFRMTEPESLEGCIVDEGYELEATSAATV